MVVDRDAWVRASNLHIFPFDMARVGLGRWDL